jgi:hypothetical protein
MATRMQQRKGTAAQWTAADPILNAGEIGWESDTNKFKIGDGTNHWDDLTYFLDATDLGFNSADYIAVTQKGVANGVAALDANVNLLTTTGVVFEGATADAHETTLVVTDPTEDRTITLPNANGTVVLADGSGNVTVSGNLTVSGTTTTINSTTINATTGIVFEGPTANDFETTLAIDDPTEDRTITLPNASGYVVLRDTNETLTNKTFTSPTISGLTLSDSSIIFEGSTANDFETTLQVTDPTADRVITIPDVNGTIITTGNLSDITDIGVFSSTIKMEGATADDYELTLSAGNPTEDREITFPNASGTVITTGNLSDITATGVFSGQITLEGATPNDFETIIQAQDPTADRTITLPDVSGTVITTGNLSDITAVGVLTTSVVFEGSTADDYELTLGAGNPTSDITISFPDAGGTLVVDSAVQTLTNKTLTSPHVSNLIITDGSIVLEGSTPNDFETTLTVTDPSADRTISFPDVTGTVVTTGDTGSVTSAMILDGTIVDGDINSSAAIAQSKISGLTTDLGNKQDKISGVSDTEIGYLSAVTSDIQAQLDAKLALAGGTMTSNIAMGTNKITGLGTPTDSADAATKAYVDALGEGLHIHASVVAATTANITLATDVENGDTLDGVTLATGNRILVKNQSTASENGIYVVAASGAPSRAADFDSPAEIDGGDFVFVTGGTANDNKGFVQINTVGTVGTDAIEFSQFSGAGTFVAGNGLTLTDNSFSINTSITADLSTAQTLTNKTLTAPKINLGLNAQTGTTYTLVLGDAGKVVTASNSSAITVTIPPSGDVAYAIGSQITVLQKGTGQVTFAQGSGVTINSTGATATAPKLRARYSSATCVYEGSDVWYVVGDIS